jgi:hypothetical protein
MTLSFNSRLLYAAVATCGTVTCSYMWLYHKHNLNCSKTFLFYSHFWRHLGTGHPTDTKGYFKIHAYITIPTNAVPSSNVSGKRSNEQCIITGPWFRNWRAWIWENKIHIKALIILVLSFQISTTYDQRIVIKIR